MYCIKIERENYRQFSKQRFVDSSGAWIPQGDHPGGLQVRPRSPQRIQTPKSKIQTQNPEPNTQNLGSPPVKPKIPTQNPKYQIQNPNHADTTATPPPPPDLPTNHPYRYRVRTPSTFNPTKSTFSTSRRRLIVIGRRTPIPFEKQHPIPHRSR